MPMYEYMCDSCEKVYEIKQGINDQTLKKCPEGHRGFRRIISSTSFVLKGGGWYKDGYGGSSKKQDSGSDSSPAEASGGGGHGCGGACSCAN